MSGRRATWFSASRLVPDQAGNELAKEFAVDGWAAVADCGWLPAPIVYDLWLATTRTCRWRVTPSPAGFPPAGRRYESWLESWGRLRRGSRVTTGSAHFLQAVRITREVLRNRGFPHVVLRVGSVAEFLSTAQREFETTVRRSGRAHLVVSRAYELLEDPAVTMDEYPAGRQEFSSLSDSHLGVTLADRRAADRIHQLIQSTRALPVVVPPIARVRGTESTRIVRAERGAYLERSQGRLPEDTGQLAPLELQYYRLVRNYFLYRLAENELTRNYGQARVPEQRDPIVQISIEVRESDAWHRASDASPFGLVSTVREMIAAILLEFRRLGARLEWDLSPRVHWHGVARASPWKGETYWSTGRLRSRGTRLQDIVEDLETAFPVLFLPPHRIRSVVTRAPWVPDVDLCVLVCDPAVPSRAGSRLPRPDLWLTPLADGVVGWGHGIPTGTGQYHALGRGSCETATRVLIEQLLGGAGQEWVPESEMVFD